MNPHILRYNVTLHGDSIPFEFELPIETGRWANILKQHRKCHLCNLEIGNKFHYLFICSYPQISELRTKFIPKVCRVSTIFFNY
jgi:hypothetical protein